MRRTDCAFHVAVCSMHACCWYAAGGQQSGFFVVRERSACDLRRRVEVCCLGVVWFAHCLVVCGCARRSWEPMPTSGATVPLVPDDMPDLERVRVSWLECHDRHLSWSPQEFGADVVKPPPGFPDDRVPSIHNINVRCALVSVVCRQLFLSLSVC